MPSIVNVSTPSAPGTIPVVTTAETLIAQSNPISTDPIESIVTISGFTDLTVGAAGTGVTLNVRRGAGTGGQLVATIGPITVTAGSRVCPQISAVDRPGVVIGQVYSITVQLAAATGNSTSNSAFIEVQAQTPN